MKDDFNPDWASAPGDTILDMLEERGLKRDFLQDALGLPSAKVDDLISGKLEMDFDLAIALATKLGGSAGFWMRRDIAYRKRLLILSGHKCIVGQIGVRPLTADEWPDAQSEHNAAVEFFNTTRRAVPHPGVISHYKFCLECGSAIDQAVFEQPVPDFVGVPECYRQYKDE